MQLRRVCPIRPLTPSKATGMDFELIDQRNKGGRHKSDASPRNSESNLWNLGMHRGSPKAPDVIGGYQLQDKGLPGEKSSSSALDSHRLSLAAYRQRSHD